MAYGLIQSKITNALADGEQTVFDSTPNAGSLLLASVIDASGTNTPTVSDTNGNWTNLASQTRSSLGIHLYGLIAVASQPTTITVDRATDNVGMNLYEFSGNQATLTGIVDQSAGTASSVSSATTNAAQPSITATVAGVLVFTQLATSNTVTAQSLSDGTFTAGLAGPSGGIRVIDYWKAGTIATYNPYFSWTTSRNWVQRTVSLKPAATAGSTAGILAVL